ncbi:quinone oxidoreductase [Asticcacaulis sp. ZE23SCel15]|uniref:quinone oxidoreductase family protein n=1 Tax=Asticcacaulis sp. ZE23SCel15 TaxID=3059027 RepID=UPI00265E4799|nr:quinone oxidoreductase [Asticcacaulis sp. ZE23SCel15]WKL57775.1 quinone oxidoreductase [Asticcacaulis sp. ZE23SCel15]
MVLAIRVHHTGGPDVMVAEDIDLTPPQAGEVRVRHTAIGVNYIDTYFRSGLYKAALPFSPGNEAAGVIEAIGEGVDGFKPGDRVVYLDGPGTYVEARNVPADKLIPLPDTVPDDVAAASLLKGLTVQYLLRRTFEVKAGDRLLFHAAAGGVGLIAGQWARHLGAYIIGTAGSQAKVDLAMAHGYDHVINYADEDFAPKALELNGGRFDVVYDSVGADTFPASLDVLKPRGLFVSFGQSSGPIPPFDIGILNAKGSLYMTRPSLFAYNATRADLLASASELFDLIGRGIITIPIHQRFALSDAALAHQALESRATTGTTILVP